MPPQSVLIVGASRGLGLALVKKYAEVVPPSKVFATVRGPAEKEKNKFPRGVKVVENIDVSVEDCGRKIEAGLQGTAVEVVVIVAGLLRPETFEELDWEGEVSMYKICAMAPVFIVRSLVQYNALCPNAKIVLLTSEAGSITLRTVKEGGGMYGHHGSKAAGNMMGRLLSFDLKDQGIPLAMVHPGFLKTEMTKNAGMEEFYEKMGAVTPEEAAVPFYDFVEKLDMSMTGKLWAPKAEAEAEAERKLTTMRNSVGARGIGNAQEVLGEDIVNHKGPLELPW